MKEFIKWANGSAIKRSITVGPLHDPYIRDIVEVTIGGKKVEVVSCSLAGDYLIAQNCGMIHSDMMTKKEYNKCCINLTGQTHDFWMNRLWHRLDDARYRHDPEARELQCRMNYCDGYYGGM